MADQIFTVTKSIDPRLKAEGHSFSAAQGASAISSVTVGAATPSNSTLTWTIVPPSPQVVIQRAVLIDVTFNLQIPISNLWANWAYNNGNPQAANMLPYQPRPAVGSPLFVYGQDWAFARAAPLGQLFSTMNVQLNTCAVQQQNVSLPDLMHVLDGPKGRAGHGTTWRPPLYASWDDAAGTTFGLGSVADMQGEGDLPPGSFTITYLDNGGSPLSGTGTYGAGANTVSYRNGIPVHSFVSASNGFAGQIYVQVRMVDVLMCSPFGFSYEQSFRETGLYGISSMLVNGTLVTPDVARLVQGSSVNGMAISGPVIMGPGLNGVTGIQKASLTLTYLSPSIQSTLPPRSVVSLCNIQYFAVPIPAITGVVAPGGAQKQGQCNFSAVSFSNVPDAFIISIRPAASSQAGSVTGAFTEADWCCTFPDNAVSQFTFANQSGLFSGWPSHLLTQMSRNNGSKASIAAYGGHDGTGYFMSGGKKTVVGGSVLVIRPGIDFPLPTGVSVGSTGQCQLQFQLNFNAPGCGGGRAYTCLVTAISSGYFVTENGVSRQLLVGLDEATVLAAPEGPDRYITSKLVGGSWFNTLGSFAKNAWANKDQIADIAKQAYSAYKDRDPMAALKAAQAAHGVYKNFRSGSGMSGGAVSAGAMAAGSMAGLKRMRAPTTLAARLAQA